MVSGSPHLKLRTKVHLSEVLTKLFGLFRHFLRTSPEDVTLVVFRKLLIHLVILVASSIKIFAICNMFERLNLLKKYDVLFCWISAITRLIGKYYQLLQFYELSKFT